MYLSVTIKLKYKVECSMAKLRVAVIFGGVSSEYEVSLVSATSVIKNMPKDKFEIICIGITKSGRWLYYPGDVELIATGEWKEHPDCASAIISPDRTHGGILKILEDGSTSLLRIDCVFPVLHGRNGEDGTIQGLLKLAGIPFVGCDTLSSALCMDKAMTHTVLDAAGIRTANWDQIQKTELPQLNEKCEQFVDKLGLPIFVKPANAGSSVGITKATDFESLREGIKFAFTHDSKVIVEEMLSGKEVECAVLGNDAPQASALGQIIPCNEFYDYDAKYQSDSELKIPADLDEVTTRRVQETAVRAYQALGCSGLARVDFFVSEDGTVYLNEPNTLPGFTSISMYPKLWEYSGLPYSELLERLVTLALD